MTARSFTQRLRPRILLDVDGPLTPGFFEAACAVLRRLGVDAHAHKINQWDIGASFGIGPETEAAMRAILRMPGTAANLEPHPGAREFVAELQEWADVYAVTSPLGGPYWAHEREEWLERVVGIPKERVVSVRDKSVVAGDAIVDDKLSTVVQWGAEHPRGLAVLWREAHNASERYDGPSAKDYSMLRTYLDCLCPR